MREMIPGYRNLPGRHCGSGAMRNLLHHYCELDLEEEVVFGLGSGIDCIYLANPGFEPPVIVFGRSVTMEADVGSALGIDYRETVDPDDGTAWEDVRREVVEGHPTMLCGDIFYLDYRHFKVHFPGHRFVLLGFDDEKRLAYVADRVDPDPQPCSYDALARSRNSPAGMSVLNLWGKFHGRERKHSLEEACGLAIDRSVARMTGGDRSQADLLKAAPGAGALEISTGLEGLARFAAEVSLWSKHADPRFLAFYASQTFEEFGTGGGNFRRMFAAFLRWAHGLVPDRAPAGCADLAARSAAGWTDLSGILKMASKAPEDETLWKRAALKASEIHGLESALFDELSR
ncbi:MAG: BtrH N-terminal domain-containing protein [Deltaproteobacteria bacterium]|nr:BtrH N-terminal domain-containing protein [Deltaproteobacteria bacterium]